MIDTLRFRRDLFEVLGDKELSAPDLPTTSASSPDIEWLQPDFVADQVNALRTGTGGADGDAAPGLHGNGVAAVTLGGVTLTPGRLARRSARRGPRVRDPGRRTRARTPRTT